MTVESLVSDSSSSSTYRKTYKLVTKFLIGDEMELESLKRSQQPMRELLMYSKIVNKLNNFQLLKISKEDHYRINIPEFVYGKCTSTDYVLVMENLNPAGYFIADRTKGLNLEETLMAVESLAKLHGVSYAYHKTYTHYDEKYPAYVFSKTVALGIRTEIAGAYDALVKLIEQKTDRQNIYRKLIDNKNALLDNFESMLRDRKIQKIICLCHGDPWISNFLFKYNKSIETDEPTLENVILIDWANCWWQNPIFDLVYLVYTSTTLSFRQKHLEEVLQHYHSTFTRITAYLNDPVTTSWSLDDLKNEWRRARLFGVLMGSVNAMVTLSKVVETLQIDDLEGSPSTGLLRKMKTLIARIILPVYDTRWAQPLVEASVKKGMKPYTKELLAGENDLTVTRVTDLLTEAGENGVFDTE